MTVDSQLMNCVVRMVVPMRREFGRNLDVRQFLHDVSYAKEVVDQALSSRDERLLEYAKYVQQHLLGARPTAHAAPAAVEAPAPAKPSVPPIATKTADAVSPASTVEQLRTQVLKKYTGGLRLQVHPL
jgi:hypothetical protein